MLIICFFATRKCPKIKKQMKTFNIDGENLHIFLTTWVISMKFPGKMWVMIVLKVTKYQALNLSLEDTFSEKPLTEEVWEGRGGVLTYDTFSPWKNYFNIHHIEYYLCDLNFTAFLFCMMFRSLCWIPILNLLYWATSNYRTKPSEFYY